MLDLRGGPVAVDGGCDGVGMDRERRYVWENWGNRRCYECNLE